MDQASNVLRPRVSRRNIIRAAIAASAVSAGGLAAGAAPISQVSGGAPSDAVLVAMGVEWERIRSERCLADARLDDCREAAARDYPGMPQVIQSHGAAGGFRVIRESEIDDAEVAGSYREANRQYLSAVADADARHGVPDAEAALAAIDAVSDDLEESIVSHPAAGICGLAVKLRVFARYAPLYSSFDFAWTLLETILADAERCAAQVPPRVMAA
jgi:hypothetical protein